MKMQLKYLAALTLVLVSVIPMKAKAQSSENVLAAKSLKWTVSRSEETKYLLYLPKGYDVQSGKRWPLMLFLHGAGERGTDLQRVAIHGPPMLAKQGKEFPFIIIAPQCPDDRRWENDGLLQLLDHVLASHAVDTNRVYLTGLSMGGYGTWRLGLTHPERFAAIAPICGGGEFIDVLLASRSKAAALRSLPVWAFHGAKDQVVPLDESERMVNVLKKVGVKDLKLTVYPDTDHNSWTETYDNPEFYEWLLKHAR